MTFDAKETSIEGGQPVRLYRFRLGAKAWRYAASDRTQTTADGEFIPYAISDDGVRQTGETSAEEFNISVPHDCPIAAFFRAAPPATEVDVTVWDAHDGDEDVRATFVGSIRGVRRATPETCTVVCQSDLASLDRPGLRLGYSRGCTHTIYDIGCGVSSTAYAVPGTVTTLTGATIGAGPWAMGDGYFAGGFIRWPIGDGEFDQRGIEQHAGSTLTIAGGTSGISIGDVVTAHPGCPRDKATCIARFANYTNYGGFPAIPGKSPYDGDPVF